MSHIQCVNLLLNNDPLICPESNEESLLGKGFGDVQETCENVVLLISKRVTAARAQKRFTQMKVDQANESIGACSGNKTITIVLDYCQNLDLPHLGKKQPGDTYYFSPIWLYCLGIVEVTKD